jgi:hypothetical protein
LVDLIPQLVQLGLILGASELLLKLCLLASEFCRALCRRLIGLLLKPLLLCLPIRDLGILPPLVRVDLGLAESDIVLSSVNQREHEPLRLTAFQLCIHTRQPRPTILIVGDLHRFKHPVGGGPPAVMLNRSGLDHSKVGCLNQPVVHIPLLEVVVVVWVGDLDKTHRSLVS